MDMASTASPETAAPSALLTSGLISKSLISSNGTSVDTSQPNGNTIQPDETSMNGSVAGNSTLNGNSTAPTSASNTPTKPQRSTVAKRIEVDSIMTEFQKALGSNWDRYRDVITHFIIGKLTRVELQQELDQILDRNSTRMHNHFMLANFANALRDGPQGENGMLTVWSKKQKGSSRNVKGDSQLAKLKEDILELSVRERKRIKAIAKESGKRQPIPSTITVTRQAMLPKIPVITDRQAQRPNSQPQPQISSSSTTSTEPKPQTPATHYSNPVNMIQDLIHAYETPLASETYEFPDNETLRTRMLGVSLEHGLLSGVDQKSPEVLLTGLEHYLKDIIQHVFNQTKLRKARGEDILTADDMSMLLERSGHSFVELSVPTFRLSDIILDDYDEPMVEAEANNNEPSSSRPSALEALLNEMLS